MFIIHDWRFETNIVFNYNFATDLPNLCNLSISCNLSSITRTTTPVTGELFISKILNIVRTAN